LEAHVHQSDPHSGFADVNEQLYRLSASCYQRVKPQSDFIFPNESRFRTNYILQHEGQSSFDRVGVCPRAPSPSLCKIIVL